MKKILLIVAILSTIFSPSAAYADGGRGHGGRGWRGDWIFPALIGGAILYDLSRPVYRPVYVQPAPVYAPNYAPNYAPVYAPTSVAPPSGQYWYFCAAANAYYPYVSTCPSGWQAVPSTPPAISSSTPYGAPPRQ